MAAEPKRLSGKRALVTGASSGIGLATARLFAAHGSAVALNGRRAQPLEELARDIGAPAVAEPGDVGVADVAESIVSRSIAALGGLISWSTRRM
jgi:NAD(P)-dependent dehydrogenase (short-subunit alcohol dehydrogenase family)